MVTDPADSSEQAVPAGVTCRRRVDRAVARCSAHRPRPLTARRLVPPSLVLGARLAGRRPGRCPSGRRLHRRARHGRVADVRGAERPTQAQAGRENYYPGHFPRDATLVAVHDVVSPFSARLSVSDKPKFCRNDWTDRAGLWHGDFIRKISFFK